MLARLVFVGALLGATAAVAQAPADGGAAPTAQDIARARALADRLIAEADAAGLFVNTTDGDVARVTHVASGMTCMFEDNEASRIHIFDSSAVGLPRGDDVGCISRTLDIDLTLYATRYRPLPSEQRIMADAVNAIRQRWPDAAGFEGDLVTISVGNDEPPLMAAFNVETDGGPSLTMALVSNIGEWGYKARTTGPAEDPMMLSLVSGMLFSSALLNLGTDTAE